MLRRSTSASSTSSETSLSFMLRNSSVRSLPCTSDVILCSRGVGDWLEISAIGSERFLSSEARSVEPELGSGFRDRTVSLEPCCLGAPPPVPSVRTLWNVGSSAACLVLAQPIAPPCRGSQRNRTVRLPRLAVGQWIEGRTGLFCVHSYFGRKYEYSL